jgi:hypothetical protein
MGRLTTLGLRLTPLDTRRVKPAPKTVEPFYTSPQYRVWREEVVRRAQGGAKSVAGRQVGSSPTTSSR